MGPFVFAASGLKTTCVTIDDKHFWVEMAQTPQQKQTGLQGCLYLPAGRGMIFPFDAPLQRTFWMKDCKISLDILFFQKGKLIDYVDAAPPCEDADCPVYPSALPADMVVELQAGSRKKDHFSTQSHFSYCKAPSLGFHQ